jgi:hypothetical protein
MASIPKPAAAKSAARQTEDPAGRVRQRGEADVGGLLERLHRTVGNGAVARLLEPIRSELSRPGEHLDPATRAEMEHEVGHELPDVHLHRGPGAARAADAANARAFTAGGDVVLGARVPPLSSTEGRRVLAHELVHVLQQSGAAQSRSFGLVPPGSRAERQATAGVAGAGAETGIARIVEKDLTQLSESELWSEYQLAQDYVAQQAPGADYDAGVAYVREIEAMVRARTPAPTAAPPASTSATGPPEENFAEVTSSMSGPEGPPLQSGRTPLQSGDIDRYGAFNTPARSGDPYAGHEVLQNAWLQATWQTGRRGTGAASRGNPSLAVDDATHARIGQAQRQLGLHDPAQLATMTDDEVIAANIRALKMAGVENSQIQVMQREALAHAARLRAGAGTPPAAPPPPAPPPPPSGEPNMTSSATGEPAVAPGTPAPAPATAEPNMTSAVTGEPAVAPGTPAPATAEPNMTSAVTGEAVVGPTTPEPSVTPTTPEPTVPAAEPSVPPEPIVSTEPPNVSTVEGEAPVGGRTGGSSASGEPSVAGQVVTNVAVPLVLGVVHDETTRAIRDSRGYAPVGPLAYAHENFFSRVGRGFTGAAAEDQLADLPARMNVTAFRANARAQAASVPVGGTLFVVFQAPIPVGKSVRSVENLAATYRRGADGRWTLVPYAPVPDNLDTEHVLVGLVMPHVGETKAGVVTPDLNVILGPASDREVARHLNLPLREP